MSRQGTLRSRTWCHRWQKLWILLLLLMPFCANLWLGTLVPTPNYQENPQIQSSSVSIAQYQGTSRLLIIISSVAREPDTLCRTLLSIQQHYPSTTQEFHVLLHRHGELSCSIPVAMNSYLTLRLYPAHEHLSNQQQTKDFLGLLKDAMSIVNGQQSAYVVFLDDDVELCPEFTNVVQRASKVSFSLSHLGRGSSGILVPSENLFALYHSLQADRGKKNVDKSMLEWALRKEQKCTIRPVSISMTHIGLSSSVRKGATWQDVDQCGHPSNNVAWQALSETHLPHFFSEYCSPNPHCSQFAAVDQECQRCVPGYSGEDCGKPSDQYVRRPNVAPIVVLLSCDTNVEDVLADSRKHHLVNLYVVGNCERTGWVADNVLLTTKESSKSFETDLKDSARWGSLAFPHELVVLHNLLTPEELWTIKYYEKV